MFQSSCALCSHVLQRQQSPNWILTVMDMGTYTVSIVFVLLLASLDPPPLLFAPSFTRPSYLCVYLYLFECFMGDYFIRWLSLAAEKLAFVVCRTYKYFVYPHIGRKSTLMHFSMCRMFTNGYIHVSVTNWLGHQNGNVAESFLQFLISIDVANKIGRFIGLVGEVQCNAFRSIKYGYYWKPIYSVWFHFKAISPDGSLLRLYRSTLS